MHAFELGVVGNALTPADRVQGLQAAQQEGRVQVALDLVTVAEYLGALVKGCFLVGIIGMVVLAGLEGRRVYLDDIAPVGLGLAGQNLYKLGRGVVLNALAKPPLAARPARLLVGFIFPGAFGQAHHGHLFYEKEVAQVFQHVVSQHGVGLLQQGLPLGI